MRGRERADRPSEFVADGRCQHARPSSDADRNVPADGRGDPTRHLDTRTGTDGHPRRHPPAVPDADAETHSRTDRGSASCHLDACSDRDSDT